MTLRNTRLKIGFGALAILIGGMLTVPADAQRARSFIPIPTENSGDAADLRAETGTISRAEVETAIREIFAAWNRREFNSVLDEEFFNPVRVKVELDNIPRTAELRLNGVREVTNAQGPAGDDGTFVTARVFYQVEFHTPAFGFVRLPGDGLMTLRFEDDR